MGNANAVGWFDIYVNNMSRATRFYESVLGLKLEAMTDSTSETEMMSFPGSMDSYGASGALVKTSHAVPGPGGTMVYFSVEDCSVQENRLANAGGILVRPKFSIGSFGFVCIGQDTEGNLIGFHSMK